jgi:2,5-diketo-D-gluconate reductase A
MEVNRWSGPPRGSRWLGRAAPLAGAAPYRKDVPVASVPTITLNNGVEIPQLGFGVFQIPPDETFKATTTALEIGYRHIDTAQMYGNEREVGLAVRESGLDRGEVFVTSKLNNNQLERDGILRSFDKSLCDTGFDYLDLFLIHWPLPAVADYVARWKVMEEIHASGRVRAIGVSNFQPHHLRNLFAATETVPAVNQIEVHPFLAQDELRAFDADHGIVTEAWAPIARGKVNQDAVIKEIAGQVGKTPAQVTLRWHVQRGDVVFPKSVTRSRVEENLDIFDFELDESAMAAISGRNRDERTGPNPDEFNYVPG